MAKRRARPSPSGPPSKSEVVDDPREAVRLERIFAFGALVHRDCVVARGWRGPIVAREQGIAREWSDKEKFDLIDRGRRGRPVPWEVTDRSTGEEAIVWHPPLEQRATASPGRRVGWRKKPVEVVAADLKRYPGSSQRERAKRLGIDVKTLRNYLEDPAVRKLTGK